MLGQYRRQWASIRLPFDQCLVLAEDACGNRLPVGYSKVSFKKILFHFTAFSDLYVLYVYKLSNLNH